MSPSDPDGPPDDRLRCRLCGDVIGVYEPLVHSLDGAARATSRAAEPGVASAPGERYHRDCYEPLDLTAGSVVPDNAGRRLAGRRP